MEGDVMLEVIEKLVGPVNPVGESHTDEKRLENLRSLIFIVDNLVGMNGEVREHKSRHEHSMMYAGQLADKFLEGLVNDINIDKEIT